MEIRLVVRRLERIKSQASVSLTKSKSGYVGTGYANVPEEMSGMKLVWKITDANFVGQWVGILD